MVVHPPGRVTVFDGGRLMVPCALMASTEGDTVPINVDLIEVDRVTAVRWSASHNEEMNADDWPAQPGSVADVPQPGSPTGLLAFIVPPRNQPWTDTPMHAPSGQWT